MLLTFLMSAGAALIFAIGGLFMKLSVGLSHPLYSGMIFVCFGLGAILQTLAINRTELGSTYISILGLEAFATLLFSSWLFKEDFSLAKLFGLATIILGVALLRGK
jgi:multidrug transporter EmrE-like cation transporter